RSPGTVLPGYGSASVRKRQRGPSRLRPGPRVDRSQQESLAAGARRRAAPLTGGSRRVVGCEKKLIADGGYGMTPEEILQVAVEKKSPTERAAFLEDACGPNGTLRAQLEGLLQAHEQAGSFLELPLFDPSTTVDEALVVERPGMIIGPYKLLEQIGEGGFGVVFRAEQSEPVRRKVALKVLKPGMDTRQVVARFEAERQALAIMDHPPIPHTLDHGETPPGPPSLPMDMA